MGNDKKEYFPFMGGLTSSEDSGKALNQSGTPITDRVRGKNIESIRAEFIEMVSSLEQEDVLIQEQMGSIQGVEKHLVEEANVLSSMQKQIEELVSDNNTRLSSVREIKNKYEVRRSNIAKLNGEVKEKIGYLNSLIEGTISDADAVLKIQLRSCQEQIKKLEKEKAFLEKNRDYYKFVAEERMEGWEQTQIELDAVLEKANPFINSKPIGKGLELSNKKLEQIIMLGVSGKTNSEIAKELAIDTRQVRRILKVDYSGSAAKKQILSVVNSLLQKEKNTQRIGRLKELKEKCEN